LVYLQGFVRDKPFNPDYEMALPSEELVKDTWFAMWEVHNCA